MKNSVLITFFLSIYILMSCSKEEDPTPIDPDPDEKIYYLPLVVHVVHKGEAIGEGPNLSTERIKRQIEILNEDFRRKEGTRGFNDHPDGGDARIEFVLAKQNLEGQPTSGIERIDISMIDVPELGFNTTHFAQYNYWDSDRYINIWTVPLPELASCMVLGQSTGPDTDLPGIQHLSIPRPDEPEGMLINWSHFGESDLNCYQYGRTLTHEMGHYLGVLHTWGGGNCEFNDYCEDTPAVDKPVYNKIFIGCEVEPVMINNYMNFSDDDLMNMFTNDQIARMHYVLEQHPGRNSLLTSPGLKEP